MAEVRKLKSMERAGTAVNNGVVSAVAADKGVVVEERAWVNRFGDAICADCGEVGHDGGNVTQMLNYLRYMLDRHHGF